jgi:hypothetical protein
VHDMAVGVYALMNPRPRAAPFLSAARPDPSVHGSAYERQDSLLLAAGPYRPGRVLAVEERIEVDVYAVQPWNWTGLYLDPGRYLLSARGQWLQGSTAYGPQGKHEGGHHLPSLMHVLGSVLASADEELQRLGRDDALTTLGDLRVPGEPWMALTGIVAAADLTDNETQQAYQPFVIGSEYQLHVPVGKPGYLYAFANSAWGTYPHNMGSVQLAVHRLPDR